MLNATSEDLKLYFSHQEQIRALNSELAELRKGIKGGFKSRVTSTFQKKIKHYENIGFLTIDKLIRTKFNNNQTKLAENLNINRGTLRKFARDLEGVDHEIRIVDGRYQLMTRQGY